MYTKFDRITGRDYLEDLDLEEVGWEVVGLYLSPSGKGPMADYYEQENISCGLYKRPGIS
jgi:hypothetical protein